MGASSELWWAFLRSGAMLAFVIALLVSILYLVRRFAPMNRTKKGEQKIKVLAAQHLSPKERLVLVQVLDRKVLIGVTPQSITTLVDLGNGKRGNGKGGDGTGNNGVGDDDTVGNSSMLDDTGEKIVGGVGFSDILKRKTAGLTGKGEVDDL
jgi:flagellar protein FliO/FliZ